MAHADDEDALAGHIRDRGSLQPVKEVEGE